MGKNMTVVPVKVDKDHSWREEIFLECLDSLENGTTPDVEVRMIYFLIENIFSLLFPVDVEVIHDLKRKYDANFSKVMV